MEEILFSTKNDADSEILIKRQNSTNFSVANSMCVFGYAEFKVPIAQVKITKYVRKKACSLSEIEICFLLSYDVRMIPQFNDN